MFQTKVVEEIKIHILGSIIFSRKSCRLWDDVERYGTATQPTAVSTMRRMRFACWITKATDTEYVILIAFPRQQWLSERASMLRYTYIACLVYSFSLWFYEQFFCICLLVFVYSRIQVYWNLTKQCVDSALTLNPSRFFICVCLCNCAVTLCLCIPCIFVPVS
jgi:hypothetical protein